MTTEKRNRTNLKYVAGLLGILGFLISGACTNLYAATSSRIILDVIDTQDLTITGTVISSDDGMPVPGANVILKGTTTGTTTDFDGNFAIDVPSSNSVLVFSSIGFASKEVTVGNNTTINVSLDMDVSALDEVIVVGFGTTKKETLTGAVEQISSEVFEDRAVSNVALALQGQTPGLTVNRSSSRPGNENVNLQIRGVTSINGGSPLIVIDGAPAFDDSEFFQMNPDDIESISVLKDGAASIYGSRAANGVILVTTKKGKGKMKIEFNSNTRMNFLGLKPPFPSYQEYGQLWLDTAEQDLAATGVANYWNWGEEALQGIASGQAGYYATPIVDGWGEGGFLYLAPADRYEDLYGSNIGHQQSLSLSGSSDQARYRLSMGVSESQGALKTAYDGIKQFSVRLNTDFDITERLNLATNISLQKNRTSSPSSGFGRGLVGQDAPIFPAKNSLGQWYGNFGRYSTNSIAATSEGGRDDLEENIAKISLNLKYDLGSGFSVNATGTYNHVNSRQDITQLTVPVFGWEGESYNEAVNSTSSIETVHLTNEYQTYGGFLNYETKLGKHNFKAMVGMTAELNEFKGLSAKRTDIVNEGVFDLAVASGVPTIGGAGNNNNRGQDHDGLYSYLTRLNYDYNEKYLVELVGRRDGSSRFAPGFKFNNYGSASVGWNIHKESFLENLESLSNLKLRASIGSSGNQAGIGRYDYVSTISQGTELFGEGGTLSNTASVAGITTTQRSWEVVTIKNIAIDFGLFNNKLSGTFETYERENKDMLLGRSYSALLGGDAPETNIGNLKTTGWEAMLNWKDQKGDFSYNIGVNMSDNTNELVNLEGGGGSIQAGYNQLVEGFPLNSYFVFETDGLFQSQAEVDAYNALYDKDGSSVPNGGNALRVGDTKIVDLDGDGSINAINQDNEKGQGDIKYVGDAQTHYVFGINLGAKYKGFDFTAFMQGALQQNVLRQGVSAFPFNNPWPNQTNAYNDLTWTPENTGATYPRLTAQRTLARWNWSNTDTFIQNNKYIRLKNIVIGYSLPADVLDKLNMDKIRIYVSGNDLFELSSLVDGYDPEDGNVPTVTDSNVQTSVYPFQRTVAVGVNLAF
ncbi:SusC/RagA family TonB-linked outer membrane protein [Zobellia barbeyronii]|uniref:SusC/RagA family TonB-linked outer membrane protein n=1 Tax=Zobellia barbeyronii TaxID=2748009 RepID=A0ABS5WDR0_9FLAO|nr:SusC/RagA family TonB-linked outer membrane protein [Zobellia barbeyronii]MBT2161541.1 SusC/RagA family TonB-linked outer membrane protein [Zobellia barbeyronii]